jgi:hypothetical protein
MVISQGLVRAGATAFVRVPSGITGVVQLCADQRNVPTELQFVSPLLHWKRVRNKLVSLFFLLLLLLRLFLCGQRSFGDFMLGPFSWADHGPLALPDVETLLPFWASPLLVMKV